LSNEEQLTASTNKNEAQSQPEDKDVTNTEETTRANQLTEKETSGANQPGPERRRRSVAEHNAIWELLSVPNSSPTARIPGHMIPPPAQNAYMARAQDILDELDATHEAALTTAQAQMESQGDFRPQDRRGKDLWLARRRERARQIMIATNVSAIDPNYEPPPPVRPPFDARNFVPPGWGPAGPPLMPEIEHSNCGMGANAAHWPPMPVPSGGTMLPEHVMAVIRSFANRTRNEDRRLRAHSSNNRRWICICMHACLLATFT
jgi:hypothetical protein